MAMRRWLGAVDAAAAPTDRPDPSSSAGRRCEGLPARAPGLLDDLLTSGDVADAATLVPRYVALPRGIAAATAAAADAVDAALAGEGTWSPDLR